MVTIRRGGGVSGGGGVGVLYVLGGRGGGGGPIGASRSGSLIWWAEILVFCCLSGTLVWYLGVHLLGDCVIFQN